MAKYEGVYACGHEGSTQIYGKVKDREWKADRRFEGVCPECYEKEKEKEWEAKKEEAKIFSEETSLPQLQGSEKQVAWAEAIRHKMLCGEGGLEEYREKYQKRWESSPNGAKIKHHYEEVETALRTINSAKWFIDNRNTSGYGFVNDALSGFPKSMK